MTSFSSQVFFSLGGEDEEIGRFLEECSMVWSSKQKAFYQLLWKKNIFKNKTTSLKKFLSKKRKRAFLSSFNKRKNLQRVDEFIAFLDEVLVFLEDKNKKSLNKGIVFLLRNESLNSEFLKDLIEIILALGFNNTYRAEKKIMSILKMDPAYFIFNPIFPGIKKEDWVRVELSLFKAFSYIKNNLENKVLRKMILTYFGFYDYFQEKEFKKFITESDLKWSLSDIRKVTKNPRASSNYLFFLSYLLLEKNYTPKVFYY